MHPATERAARVRDALRSRALTKVLIGAAVVVTACPLAPASARAAVPGLTRVVETSALGVSPWAEASARCPEGTAALSTGYEWIGGGNDLRLNAVQVIEGPQTTAWVSVSTDADGVDPRGVLGQSWGVRALLVCARPLPGQVLAYSSFTSPVDSTAMKTAVARCPAGTKVLGLGGAVNWHPVTRRLVIDENWTPNATLTAASVTAQEDEIGTPEPWRVWAMATCAEPPAGLERVAATSVGGSASFKRVTARCPADKRVVGVGGDIRRAYGEVVMSAVAPTPDLTGVRVDAYEDDTGTAANWYAVAYAVCAYP
jgi:hypothetical protein